MKLLGNDPKAAEYYKKAVNVAPTDIDLRLAYAGMLDKSGNDKEAVEEYNYILSKTTDNKDILYTLERIYKKKIEGSPNDATLTANLGAIMQKQGKFEDALRYYQKAEYLDPSNITTRINTGTLYQQKGDYKTAITAYDSILILYPDNIQANMYKAQSLAAMGDKKAALELFKKVSTMEPDNVDIKNQMMDIVRMTMTPAQFVDYVKKNSLNPADTLYNYALDLHKQNKLDDAIALYNETLKLKSTNPEVYVNLALAQSQKGDTDAALATLSSAGTKFPTNAQIKDTEKSIKTRLTDQKLDAAAALYTAGRYKEAIDAYLEIEPATADTMLSTASSYQNLNDNAKALEYYVKAFNLRPTDSEIAYYIASIYAEQEKWADAKTYATKALALNKNNQNAKGLADVIAQQENSDALEKSIALFDAEKYDESLALLNQVVKSDAQNPYGYYYRGMVYDAKTKYAEAIADYKKAIEFDPTLAIVDYLIGLDYDNLNQPKNALGYYKKFIETYAEEDDFKTYANERIKAIK
jgi:tetratricopeptide (TPR) repeat protein